MPSGSADGSISTIISRLPNIITACLTTSCIGRSRHGSPSKPSRFSCAASGPPRICAAPCRIIRRRSPSICLASSHRHYRDWTHERIRSEAAKVGARRRDPDRRHPTLAAASGAGLPLDHRHSRSGQTLWPGARRRRLRPCPFAQCPFLQIGRCHPQERRRQNRASDPGRTHSLPRQHPRPRLLQLIRRSSCSSIRPSNACAHSASLPWPT
ncbi:hypothetical protein ACVIHF_000637 [Bradyrhizobium sp. USDA 4506]